MAFRPSPSPGRRPGSGPTASLLPPAPPLAATSSRGGGGAPSVSPSSPLSASSASVPVVARSDNAAALLLGLEVAAGVPVNSSLDPMPSSSSSSLPSSSRTRHAGGPAVVLLPGAWPCPAYLQHSAFADAFVVGAGGPLDSVTVPTSAYPSGSTSASVIVPALPSSSSTTSTSSHLSSRSLDGHSRAASVAGATVTALDKGKAKDTLASSPTSRIPLPSRLDPKHCCKRLLVAHDGYGLQFMPERDDMGREKINRHDPDKDAAAVRADHPIPPQAGVYYFEVEVVSKGQKGYIGIGFSTRTVDLERLPGWNSESYGYHGDDGKAFACSGTGQAYGPKFGSGDIIGCGIDFVSRKAFFVKNGNWLGYVFDLASALSHSSNGRRSESQRRKDRNSSSSPDGAPLEFYPTVGLQTTGETVRFNFGQAAFKFDIESFVKRRKQEMTDGVLSQAVPRSLLDAIAPVLPQSAVLLSSAQAAASGAAGGSQEVDPDTAFTSSHLLLQAALQHLVASYLSHRGYSDTARAFRKERDDQVESWNDLLAPSTATNGAPKGDSAPSGKNATGKIKKKSSKTAGSSSSANATLLRSALRTTLSREEMQEDTASGNTASCDDDVSMSDAGAASVPSSSVASGRTTSVTTPMPSGATNSFAKAEDLASLLPANPSVTAAREKQEEDLLDTYRRQRVCSALHRGDVDTALDELERNYPTLLTQPSRSINGHDPGATSETPISSPAPPADLLFKLRCRKFVEMMLASAHTASTGQDSTDVAMDEAKEAQEVESALIARSRSSDSELSARGGRQRKGKMAAESSWKKVVEMDDVLQYGSELSSLYSASSSSSIRHSLETIFSLIAYPDPASQPGELGRMCSQQARDELAEELNSAMLVSQGRPGRPLLETIWRQAHATRRILGESLKDGRAAMVGDVLDE